MDIPDTAPGLLMWLQGWFTSVCNGDWEHDAGIKIETLDNPGWALRVRVADTPLNARPFERVELDRDEHDWVRAWIDGGFFHAACGPTNLSEALYLFREWVSA